MKLWYSPWDPPNARKTKLGHPFHGSWWSFMGIQWKILRPAPLDCGTGQCHGRHHLFKSKPRMLEVSWAYPLSYTCCEKWRELLHANSYQPLPVCILKSRFLWKLHGQYYPISLGLPINLITLNGWLNPSFQHFDGEIMLNHVFCSLIRRLSLDPVFAPFTAVLPGTSGLNKCDIQRIDVGKTKGTTGNLSDLKYGCSSELPLPNWEKTQSPSQVSVFWFSGSFDILSMKTKNQICYPKRRFEVVEKPIEIVTTWVGSIPWLRKSILKQLQLRKEQK